jgi:CRISPR system Cascade subunit CasC
MSHFMQIHTLTSYPAALLNRDDAGLAKRIPFGGAVRTRISSQCLKRHWRRADSAEALKNCDNGQLSVRSRVGFKRFVYQPLLDNGIDPATALAVTDAVMSLVLTGKIEKRNKPNTELRSEQVAVLGRRELDFLRAEAQAICASVRDSKGVPEAVEKHFTRERKDNIQTLVVGSGIDAAMFARFITGDILARVDAAIHVAHAFTVHAEQSETDYFSAVDDLQAEEGTAGAGHINNSELTTGLFYGYVVVDVPLLIANLGDDPKLAAEVARRMIHLIATASPGAKRGSTAPYAYADLMLVEAGDAQPRTLANAFLTPVHQSPDVVANAYSALAAHLHELDRC